MKKKIFIVQMLDSKNPSGKSFTQVNDALFYSNDTDAHLVFLPHEQEGFEFNEATVALYNIDDESLVERPAVIETFEGRKSVVLKMTEDLLAHWGRWQAQVVFKQGDKINTSVVVKFDTLRYMLDQRPPTLRDVIKVDELYSQLVTVMDEIAGKDVISAPEIILARDGFDTLGERLDASDNELSSANSEIAGARGGENTLGDRLDKEHNEVTAQLARTDNEIAGARGGFDTLGERLNDTDLQLEHLESIENANSSNILDFNNYLGNAQNIHPKVISFTQPWNGYKYWMAFTPYPKGDTDAENPSVRASNNLVDWVLPSGMSDPIDPTPPVGYNSDTHILYRPNLDRLEVWWRQVRDETNDIAIIREVSTDGINWINKQTMHQAQNTSEDMLSPAIIFEDGLYKVWYCARGSQGVKYAEMNPDATWNFKSQHVPIEWGDLSPWHLDVIHTDLGYEMVINAYDRVTESVSALDLYYVLVDDNNVASEPRKIIARSGDPNAIDFKSIYRSSILKEGDKYYIFYSSIDRENNRWMSLSFGESPFGLTGLKGQKFKESKELRISAGSNLVDLDVSGVDNLVINGGAEVTLNSLMGGYLGKRITIYLFALNARVFVQASARVRLPAGNNFVMEYTYHPTLELMCTSTDGREWRVLNNITKTSSRTVNVSASGSPTLTDYDISGISVLRVTGGGTLTIESFKPTHAGQILYVVLASSAKVKFIDSEGKIRTPGLVDYELDISEMGVTVICTNVETGECRVIG